MPRNSSGLLESVAAGLFCLVALVALHRTDDGAPVCRVAAVTMAPRPADTPVPPGGETVEAELRDMLLHD